MVIFLNSDGSCQMITPSKVYQGSNNVYDITVVAPFAASTAMQIGFVLPNGLYWQSKEGARYVPMERVNQTVAPHLSVWHYNLTASVTEESGELYVAFNAIATDGNMTSYMCKVLIEESVLPNLPTAPDPSVYELLQLYIARLDERTQNVPNLVASIQPVASNAFTYTDNSGVESAPIVLTGGESAPIPVNTASTISIPDTAWQSQYAADNVTVVGYTYKVTAGMHGQMRDGATANDLWVSFDEKDNALFKGAYEDYTVNSAGDIIISVTEPISLTVRVWNGKGLVDDVARANIVTETQRAEAAEARLHSEIKFETERAEDAEQSLQAQINYLTNTGVDTEARDDIIKLQEGLREESERAQNIETVLISDVKGLREDINNEAHFRGYLETNSEIEALSGTPNDYAYSAESGTVWIYQVETGWVNSEKVVPDQVTPASNNTPLMDGEATVGEMQEYARGDHRHPSDSKKANLSGAIFTGNITAPIITGSNGIFDGVERVYSPNNPPPAGDTGLVVPIESLPVTLTAEQSEYFYAHPANTIFYYGRNYYSLSSLGGNEKYYFSNVKFIDYGTYLSSIEIVYSTATKLAAVNQIYGIPNHVPPMLSPNAMAVKSITMKKGQYFTLYTTPFDEFLKGAYVSRTVGTPSKSDPSSFDGIYFSQVNSLDSSVSTNLSGTYQPWSYQLGVIKGTITAPSWTGNNALPNIRIGQQAYVSDIYTYNMGYMAIASSPAPWRLRIGYYSIIASDGSGADNRIGAQYLNRVTYEDEGVTQRAATAIMFTAIRAVQDATVSVTVYDGVNAAGTSTLSVTYRFNVTVEE